MDPTEYVNPPSLRTSGEITTVKVDKPPDFLRIHSKVLRMRAQIGNKLAELTEKNETSGMADKGGQGEPKEFNG